MAENAAIVDDQTGGVEHGCSKAVCFSAVKPQLTITAPKAVEAIQFYKNAFGADEQKRVMYPKRKAEQDLPLILSAELTLGSSVFLVSDQADNSDVLSSGVFCLETDDVDAAVNKARAAGAATMGEISEGEGFGCGGRVVKVKDPYGHIWMICSPAKELATMEA